MEQLNYNMLFRWFVGLGMDDAVWDASVSAKNRDRLLTQDVASKFLNGIITHKRVSRLLSRDHLSVDGTLIEAWASMKSFSPRDDSGQGDGLSRNREANFRGQKRKNDTHASTTDPAARLYRKGRGKSAQLCFMGHALMENRSGLAVAATVTHARGTAEREAALKMLECIERNPCATLGGDAAFDVWRFKSDLEAFGIVLHMARRTDKTWGGLPFKPPPGYDLSLKHRKRIEEIFCWTKTVAGQAKTKFRGVSRVATSFVFAVAANNLIRLPKLVGASP